MRAIGKRGAALLLFAASGCGAHPATIAMPGGQPTQVERVRDQETIGTENQLIVQGENRRTIRLLSVKADRPNGYLRLYIGFQNTARSSQSVNVEVHYFDEAGLPIQETSGWIPVEIDARSSKFASVTCVRKEAATFKVHMTYR